LEDRTSPRLTIDGLQYCNWSDRIFDELRDGGVDAIHVTVCYHEDFRETVSNLVAWQRLFDERPERLMPGRTAEDVRRAADSGRTAVFFGLQNCTPIEGDPCMVQMLHDVGIRFMQLSYNHAGPLATGWLDEDEDKGVTPLGREVIREMNRCGLVVDMSHSAERSTLEAIELSERPIAISHANPSAWCDTGRNKSDDVLTALGQADGMLGFSLYPRHLRDGSACTLESFCTMVARTADLIGVRHLGIGSDLCQDQPDAVVRWMRTGVWDEAPQDGAAAIRFPRQPSWFMSNLGFPGIAEGLRSAGFSDQDVRAIMGENWLRFFEHAFQPMNASAGAPAPLAAEA